MSQNFGRDNRNFNGRGNGYNNSPNNAAPVNMDPLPLPERYVDAAEAVIQKLPSIAPITNTKIRKIFGLFTDIYNGVKRASDRPLNGEQIQALSTARVRMVYECGRDESTKSFVQQAKLINYLKDIGDNPEKLIAYYNYFEALVAYHRFRFGEKG